MNQKTRNWRGVFARLFFIIVVCAAAAPAQTPSSSPFVSSSQATSLATTGSQTTTPPATPGETQTIKGYTLTPEKYQRAVDYSKRKYIHYFVSAFYGLVVLLLVLVLRLGPKYRDWAEKISSRRFVQGLIYSPLLLLTVAALGLPTDVWDQQLQRGFGLSVQGWGSWGTDWVKNQAVGLVVGMVLVWILYAVVRRSPRRWWLYFWLASLPVLLFVIFLAPLVIEPMFFKFEPLAPRQPVLVAEIEKVVARGGMSIPRERMFEMNASTKLTGLNAYVAGFGASKRVVVWDTTIAKATIPQILYVFGHEMGHYVLLHIPKELAMDALALLVLMYLGFRSVLWALGRWGSAWGIRGPDDWASLPVLMLALGVLSFLASPVFNSTSRYFEHEADRYGLEVIHGIVPDAGQVAAHYFQTSGELNLADPDPSPFMKIWFFDHPSRKDRIDFVVNYDPWGKGEEPVYVK
ncbi:MAG TPA: M48 family metallopeptidase [Candidatus Acidoferrales bacterium]|nr:M48 family metallopeptidase [Candidatus Acidoferrales bacterium]